jgi:hypothetical protein
MLLQILSPLVPSTVTSHCSQQDAMHTEPTSDSDFIDLTATLSDPDFIDLTLSD